MKSNMEGKDKKSDLKSPVRQPAAGKASESSHSTISVVHTGTNASATESGTAAAVTPSPFTPEERFTTPVGARLTAATEKTPVLVVPMVDSPGMASTDTSPSISVGASAYAGNFLGPTERIHSPGSAALVTPGKMSVPLLSAPFSNSFSGSGNIPMPTAARRQANNVAQNIVRSASTAFNSEAITSALESAARSLSATGHDSMVASADPDATRQHPADNPPPAPSGEHKGPTVTQKNALDVLRSAVNSVRAHLKAQSESGVQATSEEKQAGTRIARAVRAVMRAAEMIDQEEEESGDEENELEDDMSSTTTATHHSHRAVDWRDDSSSIISPSTFFHDTDAVEVCSNRVMDYIIAKGHAAQTDAEVKWLYRHSLLTSLLDDEDLDRLVPRALHREYTSGETILNAGTLLQHMYVVVWGDVDIFRIDSLSNERKAVEGAFKVSSHQTAALRRASQARSPSRRRSSVSPQGFGAPFNDATDNSTSSTDAVDCVYTHVGTLYPGQAFGIENCVFNAAAEYVFKAGSATHKTVISLLPYRELQSSLSRNPRFAQGVGVCIVGAMDVFGPIREFCRYVFSPTSAQNEYLPLWSILESYTRIQNVIHTKIFSQTVDTGAWGYALNRLPDNVTSTFCFDLVHSLPPFVASRMRVEARRADTRKAADAYASTRTMRTAITYIRTKERRRCTWHLGMEGKTLVLLRDGFTDLLDFLTMLCVHIIESNKLRGRMQGMVHPPAIDILDEYLRKREQEEVDGTYLTSKGISKDEEMVRVQGTLARMPLTEEEQTGLLRNWGHNTLLRLYEIMMHREEFNVRVDPSLSMKFQTNPFHEWALNLRGCVLEKLGLNRFSAIPDNLYIDVISSNTHCIKNLLCSFNRKYRKEILEYVRKKEGKRLGRPEEWHNVDDMLYASVNGFLQSERPDLREEYNRTLEENGITVLEDTAMTGLQVDVIPVHLLNFDTIDSTIRDTLHDYYEEVTQLGDLEGESGASFSKVPTWAQVCKPIWRRGPDGEPMCVPGCLLPHHDGDISTNAAAMENPPSEEEEEVGRRSCATAPSSRKNASPDNSTYTMSMDESPQMTPTGHHGHNGRLQRHFIINMDFAFGAQAEGICRVIFSAFGKRIRSVSVMGKAGGLAGKRGDIQLASHVLLSKSSLILEDNQDELRNCRNQDLRAERLQELAGPKVAVHHGKVLTVTGTILQNVHLLRYYQQVWRCVGTEMEGSYFARVIEDFYRQGIAHPRLVSRFAYYTSDLPLAQSDAEMEARLAHKSGGGAATLSASMTPQEGVPPLYAIARGILENVLL